MSEEKTYEMSLVKIKEGQLKFIAKIFAWAQDYVNDEYPEGDAKPFVRNSPDGCYEVFLVITEIPE